MHNNVRHLLRPSDDPNHVHYGPCRRLGMMFMQIFADQPGGFEGLEKRLWVFQESQSMEKILWDEHLCNLMRRGINEPHAQRIIMQQMLYAMEWVS